MTVLVLRDLVADVQVAVLGAVEPLIERDLVHSMQDLQRMLVSSECAPVRVTLDDEVTLAAQECVVLGAIWRLLAMPSKPWSNMELAGIKKQQHNKLLNRLRLEYLACRIMSEGC